MARAAVLHRDEYGPCDQALPVGRHYYVGKDETVMSERSNARLRPWFARLRRRTVLISRSAAMVDRIVALVARYHCDGAPFTQRQLHETR